MTALFCQTQKRQGQCGQTMQSHLFLKSLQRLKLLTGQFDLDVFGNIWDEEGQDELESQQCMLK